MESSQRLVLVLLAAAVIIPVVFTSRQSQYSRVPAAFSVPSSARGYVRISGNVMHPGMYLLGVNKMATDVIAMAEPLQAVSSLEPAGVGSVPVANGEALHLLVRSNGRALVSRGAIPAAERLVMGIPLDLASVSEAELDKVPGIGPALAMRIVRYRQNNGGKMSVQELLLVEGVGEKKFASLCKYF